jgi:hypothetical protein
MKAVADRFAGPKPKSGGRFGAQKPGGSRVGGERGPQQSGSSRFGSSEPKSGGRFGGGEKKYRSQDRGGRFGRELPAARPTTPNPGRGRPPVTERADSGSTKRFDRAPVEDNRPSRRFNDKGGGRFDSSQRSRREGPPPQAWEKKPAVEKSEEEPKPKGGFDARATLDRLWKERGGKR